MFEENFDDSTHISDYFDIFLKRKWIMLLIFVIVLSISVFYTIKAVPVYQSTSTIIIDKESSASPITGRRMEYESYYSESLTFNTHFKLILSKPVVKRVVEILSFDKETETDTKELEISSIKKLIKKYKQNIKSLLNKEPEKPLTPNEKFNNLINAVRSKVTIQDVEETRLLKISVKDRDPDQAADIANVLAKQYIEFNLSNRMNSSRETLEWMNNELYSLKKRLEDDEKRFFDFKQQNKVFSITGKQKMVDQKLSEFNTNYLSTRNKRLDLDTRIREIEKQKGPDELGNIRSLIDNNTIDSVYTKIKNLEIEYANLSKVFKSKHPKIIQVRSELDKNTILLDEELKKELASLKAKRQVLYSQEKVLKDTIDEFEQDALDTSGNELEYSILQRNLNTSKHLYDTLLAKIKESNLLKTSDTSNIRLVEEALVPVNPISPNKKRNIMMGIVAGIALSALFALLLEYMDQTIRTEEDVEKYLDLPVLSIVPKADKTGSYGA